MQKKEFDSEIKNIIGGNGKFLLIVGPCSADNPSAVLAYCEKLKVISEKVKDKIFIVPRIYTTKPRSESGALDISLLFEEYFPGLICGG